LQARWGIPITDAEATFKEIDRYYFIFLSGEVFSAGRPSI
jgi:hypothetical protein